MKLILSTAGAFALVLAACGGYTPIGEGEAMGGSSGTGGSTMTGGSGSVGGGTTTGGSGGSMTTTGGTGGSMTATGGTGGSMTTGGTGGAMTGGTGGTGTYDPCANRACGTLCSPCPPDDPMCVSLAVASFCDAAGECHTTFPTCPSHECETSMDCAVDLACHVCSDGSTACPTAECVMGQCVTSYPTCPNQMCMTAEECPVSDAPCIMCKDGNTVCPWSDCVNGVCTTGIDSCSDTSPCDGKSCGDFCTPCVGTNCDAMGAPIMAASYCNENLECVFNVPMCTTNECKLDMDCPAPDVCMTCPNSDACAAMKCVNGACQWQCNNPCGGCAEGQECIYQVGGPGPSRYTCAKTSACEAASPCACIQDQGMCQAAKVDGYCHCDNGDD